MSPRSLTAKSSQNVELYVNSIFLAYAMVFYLVVNKTLINIEKARIGTWRRFGDVGGASLVAETAPVQLAERNLFGIRQTRLLARTAT